MVFWNRKDPGLYNCWNLGIRMARRTYISNANVDDLRDPAHVVSLIRDLEQNPEVLVAATALNPFHEYPADGTLPDDRPGWYSDRGGLFNLFDLAHLSGERDLPNWYLAQHAPLHAGLAPFSCMSAIGWFDEARYGPYADWAFWMKSCATAPTAGSIPNRWASIMLIRPHITAAATNWSACTAWSRAISSICSWQDATAGRRMPLGHCPRSRAS